MTCTHKPWWRGHAGRCIKCYLTAYRAAQGGAE